MYGAISYTPPQWTKKVHFGYTMARCSEIAYLNNKEAKAEFKRLGFTAHKFFNVGGAQCHCTWNDEWFIVAFRGTEGKEWSDIKADLSVDSVNAKGFVGRVQTGFQHELDKLIPKLSTFIMKKYDNRKVVYTGHSLGAAMATLAASRAETHVDSLFTYGSPRVGNAKFVNSLSYLPHFRFVNNADAVTKVPFRHWGYRHHGELRYIDAMGNVDVKSHMWSRFWDRIVGRLDGILNKNYFDGVSDHSCSNYCDYLQSYEEEYRQSYEKGEV
jgi:hypothetical protein